MPRKLSFAVIAGALGGILLSACGNDDAARGVEETVKTSQCADQIEAAGARWLSAWGGTRTTGPALGQVTVRNITRVTAGGKAIRLRLFNLDAAAPLKIGKAFVGIRDGSVGPRIVAGTSRQITFDCGGESATIPPGTWSYFSDAIEFPVRAQDDVAVSLFIQGPGNPGEYSTEWTIAHISAPASGDLAADESGVGFTSVAPAVYAVRDVEVLTTEATGAIVFLGSSSVQGYNSTPATNQRFPDQISARINSEIPAGRQKTVVNRGLGADTLESAMRWRLWDVWSTTGVDTVVVWATNDLASRGADAIIRDYYALIAQAHERNISVICPTWLPAAQSTVANWTGERDKLNDWILNSHGCDAAVDYDAVVRNPVVPNAWHPLYMSDQIHANDAGHAAWAQATPIDEWLALTR